MNPSKNEPLGFDVLVEYWRGELSPEQQARLEERLFEDETSARRLEIVARLGSAVASMVRRGQLRTVATLDTLQRLRDEGVTIRGYRVGPGQIVPCTVAAEDFVAIVLHGTFEGLDAVDLEVEASLEGESPRTEHLASVLVDRTGHEVVLLYPGDLIRALPRSEFVYRATTTTAAGPRTLGEFRLHHTPPS